jgi:hypothetical protein
MSTQRARELPSRLVRLRRRFEDWRRTRKVRSRIPEPLWDSAVKLAGVYGLHRTAKALRVNYYALKKRVEREADCGAADVPEATGATFLELTATGRLRSNGPTRSIPTDPCECTLELEAADGAKMRVRLSGVVTPDLVALSRSFWRAES